MKRCSIGFLILVILLPTSAFAALTVKPRLDLRTEYNDNLFLEANRAQGDQISTVAPGIDLEYAATHLHLDVDYSLLFRKYNKNSELDETKLGEVQRADAQADIFPGRDFTIHISDNLSRVSLDPRRALALENDFFNKSSLNRLLVNPSYTFRKIKHFTATLGYLYDRSDYEAAQGDDSEGHAGSLELRRDLSANLTLLAGGRHRAHRAELTEDYNRQDYYGGARIRVSPRVAIEGRAGQARIQPDDRPDTNSVLVTLGVDYEYSPQLLIRGQATQDYTDSATFGLYRNRTLRGTLAYSGKIAMDLSGQVETGDYEEVDREDRSAGVGLTFGIPLGSRTRLGLGGDFTYFNFRPEDEVAYRYGGNVSLSYTYGYLFLRGSYAYRVNDSTFAFNDYRNNIVVAEIGLRL